MLRPLVRRAVPQRMRAMVLMVWSTVSEFVLERLDAVVAERNIEGIHPDCRGRGASSRDELLEVFPSGENERYLMGLTRRLGHLSTRRAHRYLRSGYGGVAVLRGDRVVGDVWYVTLADARLPHVHADVSALKIDLDATTAYLFDMYIEPEQRGMALSTALFRAVFATLRARGFTTAVGYYAGTNRPALWMHRVLGYREVRRVRIIRAFRRVVSYSSVPL
jgi:GNAT superfamily N-acetyltransferase